jgi:hypothetical protein
MCFSKPPAPQAPVQQAPVIQAPPTPAPNAPVLPQDDSSTNPRLAANARKRLRIDLAPRVGTGLAIPQ